jgi:hypothetical protein
VRDRVAQTVIAGVLVLAVAIVLGSALIGRGIRHRNDDNRITVTGSAKKRIVSDYVVWDLSITSQQPSAAGAARELAGWTASIRSFLTKEGVEPSELTVDPVSTETIGSGTIKGYRLSRSFEIRSSRVRAVAGVAEHSSRLLAAGIPLSADSPQYVYTKLPSLRPELLSEATRDAQHRGKVLVAATGDHLGGLRGVDVGVFQVTSPNSTEVEDYGVYDTSTLEKDVTAVVNVTFAIK